MTNSVLDLSHVAQSNVALYRQMHELGYDENALRLARDAYELVSIPFAGHYRACGKPFVCHLIGTASIMASLGAGAELVAAAVLHSSYEPYFFVGNNQGAARLTPDRIRTLVGEAVERRVAAYNSVKWNLVTIPALAEEAKFARGERAGILLLKLANEVDDHLDLSMAYCSESRRGIDTAFDLWIEMARALGHPPLAVALTNIRREQAEGDWARPLGTGRATSHSVLPSGTGSFGRLRARMRKLVEG